MNDEIRTLTVLSEDRPGLMTEITGLLAEAGINLRDFSGDVIGGSAVFNFIPDRYEDAFRVLKRAGFRLITHRNLLLHLADEPGALARLSRRLSEAGIETRGVHIVGPRGDASLVAIEVLDPDTARELLADIVVRSGA